MDSNFVAAMWIGLALLASLMAIRTGISVSLLEVLIGVIAGNFLNLSSNTFVDSLAGFGSVLLVFLAGAEVDSQILRSKFRQSFLIGFFSFLIPLLAGVAFAYFIVGWDIRAAEIAGLVLSCTSVAVVYTVMLETGLNSTELGKIMLVACFVTNFCTVLVLTMLSASFNIWLLALVVALAMVLFVLPRFTGWFFATFAGHMSEPETKYILVVLFSLAGLAALAKSQAVLPAYLVGIALANVFMADRGLVRRTRSIAFTFLTPFFFIKSGLNVSLPVVVGGAGIIVALLMVKMAAKFLGILPVTTFFKIGSRDGIYTTLLLSTGLTFDIIVGVFGLNNGFIDQGQYGLLVSAVIASAVVPTIIAQTFFKPKGEAPAILAPAEVSGALDASLDPVAPSKGES